MTLFQSHVPVNHDCETVSLHNQDRTETEATKWRSDIFKGAVHPN